MQTKDKQEPRLELVANKRFKSVRKRQRIPRLTANQRKMIVHLWQRCRADYDYIAEIVSDRTDTRIDRVDVLAVMIDEYLQAPTGPVAAVRPIMTARDQVDDYRRRA